MSATIVESAMIGPSECDDFVFGAKILQDWFDFFFEFSDLFIEKWVLDNATLLEERFQKYFNEIPKNNTQGLSSKMKIYNKKLFKK